MARNVITIINQNNKITVTDQVTGNVVSANSTTRKKVEAKTEATNISVEQSVTNVVEVDAKRGPIGKTGERGPKGEPGQLNYFEDLAITGSLIVSGGTGQGKISGEGLEINGPSNSHVEVGTYNIGYDNLNNPALPGMKITGSGLIVSGVMDTGHHNFIKIGNVELIDVNTTLFGTPQTTDQFLIHNARSFKITSGSEGGDVVNANKLFVHDGHQYILYINNEEGIKHTLAGLNLQASNIYLTPDQDGAIYMRSALAAPTANAHLTFFTSDPSAAQRELKAVQMSSAFPYFGGAISATSISASNGITGSLLGTASFADDATSASFAITSSYAHNATSASFATTSSFTHDAISASFATTSSFTYDAISASFAATSSFAHDALSSSYALTASFALNAGGSGTGFPFTGSAEITGSLTVDGPITASGLSLLNNLNTNGNDIDTDGGVITSTGGFTGDLDGTASFATTASYALNANSGEGFPFTGSAEITGSLTVDGPIEVEGVITVTEITSDSQDKIIVTSSLDVEGKITGSGVKITGTATPTLQSSNNIILRGGAGPSIVSIQSASLEVSGSLVASGSLTVGQTGVPTITSDSDLVLNIGDSVRVTGPISASTYHGDGGNLTGIGSIPFPFTGSAETSGSFIVEGLISASGELIVDGLISASGQLIFEGELNIDGGITASGDKSASGAIYAETASFTNIENNSTGIPTIISDNSLVITASTAVVINKVLRLHGTDTGSISFPTNGDIIYDNLQHKFFGYANGNWVPFNS